jgi:hypothetical protein
MVKWEVQPHRRAAFMVIVSMMFASLAVVVFIGFRAGGYALAATFALAALVRAVFPAEWCLGLLIRSRRVDVAFFIAFAIGLAGVVSRIPGSL